MADIQFLRLNEKWALAYDSRQWVVQRRSGVCKTGDHAGEEIWRGRKFIGTTIDHLYRAIAELKIKLSDETVEELARLPATFGEFLEQRGVDRPEEDVRSKRHGRSRAKPGSADAAQALSQSDAGLWGVKVPERAEIAPSATLNEEAA